ncbi:PREDICTED: uncharacterized protein LOC104733942 [Camelina sativa]|uniref:Uncharacterized protein LOC104733942 n=1 Tax=Camelina sativa TaxID=90675 RepID=A0ABM0V6R6_CAMSA|nr:PREDICTED: uncharacterized protein LOC104733942 [Camelina sativa]
MDAIASESFLGGMKADFHEHLVYPTNISSLCDACYNSEVRVEGEGGYICNPCDLYVHKACIEINNPYRHKHPLKLLQHNYVHEHGKKCLLCKELLRSKEYPLVKLFYHCFICDISVCNLCPSKPLVIDDIPKKIHEHPLTQMMIKVSFTCEACGVCRDGFPCVCLQCSFIIHRYCTQLPRVIRINRHEHRVSHTYSLGPGDWVCGVCHKCINRLYGAYSCSICRYAVHSKCVKRDNVWDGFELEDEPEDDYEDLDPFKVVGEGVIIHFSHKHHLRLTDNNHESVNDGNRHCYACTFPIYYDPCYTCEKCHFVLHETCANLPKRKQHEVHNRELILNGNPNGLWFHCEACRRICTGFSYRREGAGIDVCCAMVSKTFNHESHQHPLFFLSNIFFNSCGACDEILLPYLMRCIECDYELCFKCATLPKKVIRHKHDRHPLSLCYGKNASGLYWCEICEATINPKGWFYVCNDCASTLHVWCILGNFIQVRPGHIFITKTGEHFEVVDNIHHSRPFCSVDECRRRCIYEYVLESKDNKNTYACDPRCLMFNKR